MSFPRGNPASSQESLFDGFVKSPESVIPAEAGIHSAFELLDSRLHGNGNKKNYSFTKPPYFTRLS